MAVQSNPQAVEMSELSRRHFAVRKLGNQCAPLKKYLRPGLEVLDAGCGPGTITADVAASVSPGKVRGVDLGKTVIQEAGELAVSAPGRNLSFEVGDGTALRFPDASFDLVYSHSLLEYLRDPHRALVEHRRVTRNGGWVIAITSSHLDRFFYPRCPAVEKLLAASLALADPARAGIFFNSLCSRQAVGMFKAAGFRSLEVEAYGAPVDCVYPGSEFFEYRYKALAYTLGDPKSGSLRPGLEEGLFDEATILQARREIEAWHEHPSAFYLQPRLLVAGRCD